MIGVRSLEITTTGLDAAFIKYKARCEQVLILVFGKTNYDTRRAFEEWLTVRYEESTSKPYFLHEDPFYRVASYLGFSRFEIPAEYIEAVSKVAREKGW